MLSICFVILPASLVAETSVYRTCENSNRNLHNICRGDGVGKNAGHFAINSFAGTQSYQAYFFPDRTLVVSNYDRQTAVSSISVSRSGLVGRNLGPGEYFPSNKNFNNTLPGIRAAFLGASDWRRKAIQRNLKRLELYQATIDGLWGRNTFNAIIGYNAVFRQTLSVDSRNMAEQLLIDISNHSKFNYKDGKLDAACSYSTSNRSSCPSSRVCHYAVAGTPKRWNYYSSTSKGWVAEAKRRKLSCGVKEQEKNIPNHKTCEHDPSKCGALELCQKAVQTKSGKIVWRNDSKGKRYADAAKSIGLSCNVDSVTPTETYRVANGTGFYVTEDGYVVTNQHVIEACDEVQLHTGGQVMSVKIVAQDKVNDLAILKTDLPSYEALKIAPNNPYLLQEIIAAGFPFGDSISSSIKVTKGVVSSLSGLGDNSGQIQIDAALQPGNSGGPIIDENGNVVGVAVAKLDLEKSIEHFGVVPENVNFGIKISNLRTFLDDNGVNYTLGEEKKIEKVALGKLAADATVLLSCWISEAPIKAIRDTSAIVEPVQEMADSIMLVSWGGAYQNSQQMAYVAPYLKNNARVNVSWEVGSAEAVARLRAMNQSGHITWDLIDVVAADAIRLCNEGLAMRVNHDALLATAPDGTPASEDFGDLIVSDCFIPQVVYSVTFGYRIDMVPAGVAPPSDICSVFDLKNYPGKRALEKHALNNMEWALLCDGVAKEDIYEVLSTAEGQYRALAKLDTIRDHVIWWTAGADTPQLLADGEVFMGSTYNGRLFTAIEQQGQPIGMMWDAQVFDVEGWVIPANLPEDRLARAKDFVRFATDTQRLADQAKYISYGPARASSVRLVGRHAELGINMSPHMPTNPKNSTNRLLYNYWFWAAYRNEIDRKFQAWLARN